MPEFQFINLSTGSTLDDASRRRVRQNAMQSFSRQKVSSPSKNRDAFGNILEGSHSLYKFRTRPATSRGQKKGVQARVSPESQAKSKQDASEVYRFYQHEDSSGHLNSDDVPNCAPECPLESNLYSENLESHGSSVAQVLSMSRIPRSPTVAGLMDPFLTAALPLNSRMQELLHRYVIEIPQSVYPIKTYTHFAQSGILTMAISDEALLHSIIAYATMHKTCYGDVTTTSPSQMVKLIQSNPKYLSHQLQAVQMVNRKLKVEGVSDALIATVLTLLWRQNWTGGGEDTDAHFKGLQYMIIFRGGMGRIPRALALATLYTYSKYSAITQSRPVWPRFPAEFTVKETFNLNIPHFDGALLDLHFPNLRTVIGDELYEITQDVYRYTAYVNHYRFRGAEISPTDCRCFENWSALLDYRLLSYPTVNLVPGASDPTFLNALRRAVLLWIDTGTWQWNTSSTLVRSQASNLATLLQQSDLRRYRETCPDLLLWVLVVGGCSSPQDTAYRHFFMFQLNLFYSSGYIWNQQHVEHILKKFIYIDGTYAASLALLWREMMRKPGVDFVSRKILFANPAEY